MKKSLSSTLNSIEELLIKKIKEAIGVDALMLRLIQLPDITWNSYKAFFLSKRSFKLKAEFILCLHTLSDESLRSFSNCQESFRQFQIDKRNGVKPKLCT